MKKLLLVLALALALTGCGRKTTDGECERAWSTLTNPGDNRGTIVQLIMNSEWPTASVGYYLQNCMNEGWLPQ